MTSQKSLPSNQPITVSHAFGEVVWLISQSPLHNKLPVVDLGWLVMPAIRHKQFHLFRDGQKPVGVALWAKVDSEGERKLAEGIMKPGNHLEDRDWTAGDIVWLVDLIAPFATAENKHVEVMFGDLVAGPMNGQPFKMHRTDPKTGQREVVRIPADLGEKLRGEIKRRTAMDTVQ